MHNATERIRRIATKDLESALASLSPDQREEVLERVVTVIADELERERKRAVRLCLHRAELWNKTPAAEHPDSAEARAEARSRQNEARVLADLIASKTEGDRLLQSQAPE
jgi:hypothetical protein